MSDWEGKSRGTLTGYQVFIYLIKHAGLNGAYSLLTLVALYYFFFTPKQTLAIYRYFRNRRKNSILKSLLNSYRNYYVFGQTIIDKVAITAGLSHKFTYEFDGIEHIHELAKNETAGVLISAHIGNFEVAQYFMDEFDKKIHLVTTDAERQVIKAYLDSVMSKPKTEFIIVENDLSHIFEINRVINEQEMICFTGDRFMTNTKTIEGQFLGKSAHFPAGPFLISSRLNTPVLFVYVMRERGRHYHLYARKANFKNRDAASLLEAYTESMEQILMRYPLQWFNYYDFWATKEGN